MSLCLSEALKASYTKVKHESWVSWILLCLLLAECMRLISQCLPTSSSGQQRKSDGERRAPEHGPASKQTRTCQTCGERKEKAATLPDFSETGLQLFRRVVQTTQELLRVQLRKEHMYTPQDHQTRLYFCVHVHTETGQGFCCPTAAKARLPPALWVIFLGLTSIPGTLGTNRLISRGRKKERFIVQSPKSAPDNLENCALFKIFQWIPTSLRINSQFPMLAFT